MFKRARGIVRASVLLPLAADQLSGWKPALFTRKLYTMIITRKLIHYEQLRPLSQRYTSWREWRFTPVAYTPTSWWV